MDIGPIGSQVSEEAARELLIGISYSLPENSPSGNTLAKKCDSVNSLPLENGKTEKEKYRSELISLSYVDSPDIEVVAVAMADREGL